LLALQTSSKPAVTKDCASAKSQPDRFDLFARLFQDIPISDGRIKTIGVTDHQVDVDLHGGTPPLK
jgi:hypothetical protein